MADMTIGVFCSMMAARDDYARAGDEFFNALTERRTNSEIRAALRRFHMCCQTMHSYAIFGEMDRQLIIQFQGLSASSDDPNVISVDC